MYEYNARCLEKKDVAGTHDMCTCHKCKRKYKVDVLVPDDVWARIRPDKDKPEGAGLMCGACILTEIERLGEYAAYTLIANAVLKVRGTSIPLENIVITQHRRIAMSRELRMVPKDWEHPKREDGRYTPLFDGYRAALQGFEDAIKEKGLADAIDYYGGGPMSEDYMPDWPDAERTHYMMYETTSEGTPISPAFETPEELARWLADNEASAFSNDTATYEQWLRMIRGPGWAPSAFYDGESLKPGVAL